jgi:ferric-dicitrate binding protein FerR (iron transport regulator)
MAELSKKVQRALGAMPEDGWSDLQHRRVAKKIDEALDEPRRSSRPWAFGGLALAASVLLVAGATQLGKKSAPAASVAEATPTTQVTAPIPASPGSDLGDESNETNAVLSDGSAIEVNRGGRLHVVNDRADETRLELVAGRAEFEVQKRPERPFITSVRGVEVRVVGTHFSTELDTSRTPSVVRVLVQRGIVEVRNANGGSVTRLTAGESLEVPVAAPAAVGTVEPTRAAPAPPPLAASQLFEAARTARGAGDVEGAARSYAALLKQYPNDERAGIAALELGRLRMDSQHAYGPAADAFRRAIAAAPNEGVREDAMARLVEALDALRDRDGCSKERQKYLARYPKGVHAAAVEGHCAR